MNINASQSAGKTKRRLLREDISSLALWLVGIVNLVLDPWSHSCNLQKRLCADYGQEILNGERANGGKFAFVTLSCLSSPKYEP